MKHKAVISFFPLGIFMLASCQDNPEPHSVLKKAIAAHGGADKISKPRLGVLRGKDEKDGPKLDQEETFDLPGRWKRVIRGQIAGKRKTWFAQRSEGKLWEWEEGMEPELAKNQAGSQPHFGVLTVLLTLTGDKVKLSRLRKTTIDGKSAVGFRALWDANAADYYFDEETELLVQSSFTWIPEPGREYESKTIFRDYKELDGVKFPYRRTTYIRGDSIRDFVTLTVKILEELPDDVFELLKKK
jgi:hypothetical protein